MVWAVLRPQRYINFAAAQIRRTHETISIDALALMDPKENHLGVSWV